MRKTITFKQARRGLLGAGFIVSQLLLSSAAILPLTGASEALPRSCVIRLYYNNAELETQVGMRSSCPGGGRWGKITKFVEVETVDLQPEGPGRPGGPRGLPCEFLADGCSNLPELRP